ncbi:MAG TPA: hypothetical protein VKY45_08235, partial [Marinilabiliaceae bacterium]|nr:hypothetical protein [Marinilabiliaceae bacterium]
NVAAMMQPKDEHLYGRLIPWFGLIGCLTMSVSLPLNVIISGVGLLFIGFIFRVLLHKIYNR